MSRTLRLRCADGRRARERGRCAECGRGRLHTIRPALGVRHVELHEARRVTDILRRRLPFLFEHIADHDLRALVREESSGLLACPSGGSGNDGDFSFETGHGGLAPGW